MNLFSIVISWKGVWDQEILKEDGQLLVVLLKKRRLVVKLK